MGSRCARSRRGQLLQGSWPTPCTLPTLVLPTQTPHTSALTPAGDTPYDVATGQRLQQPAVTVAALYQLNESHGSLLMACAADGAVRVWRDYTLRGGQRLATAWQSVLVASQVGGGMAASRRRPAARGVHGLDGDQESMIRKA